MNGVPRRTEAATNMGAAPGLGAKLQEKTFFVVSSLGVQHSSLIVCFR